MTNYERENEISTDEIIKRLERCVKCGNRNYDTDIVLDLIYRQQEDIDELKHEREVLIEDIHCSADKINEQLEEIERLKADNKTLENVIKNTFLKKAGLDIDPLAEIKSEAIKEFAERLNEKVENARKKYQRLCREQGEKEDETKNIHFKGIIKLINNLLKEMVG